ncbi:unnamed protein product [Symbiodinium sp. CCMP2592]|nr:unnamed protein product [Symbiodinium sp. CCMP2592]
MQQELVYAASEIHNASFHDVDQNFLRRLERSIQHNGVSAFFAIDRNGTKTPGRFGLIDVDLAAVLPPALRDLRNPRTIVLESPSCFDITHLAGMNVLDVLSHVHLHPRDCSLQFEELEHIYTWEGRRVSVSVTSLIHGLTHQFNSADALRAMRNGRNWPREEYTVANVVEVLNQHLPNSPLTLILRHLVDAEVTDIAAICQAIRDLVWTHPGCSHLASVVSMTDDEILDRWERNRRTAAAQGTWMHACCECLLNGGMVCLASEEMCMFTKVIRGLQAEGWMIFRTEWCVYCEAEDVAGSIDAVAVRQNEYCILDWKRTKALASKDAAYGRMMHFPMNDVPDSVLWHYRVQVNIYAWILRRYYDINVTELRIVCLHPDNAPQPLIVNVPMMQDKIEKLMSWRRDDRQLQIHLSAESGDLRGGSQEGELSFSQMLDQEMDTYEDVLPEVPSADERSSKRHKAQESVEGATPDNAMSQFMQTDFDMSSIPGQSSERESVEGSILKEIGGLERMITAYRPSAAWSTAFRHVVQGALAVHQLRLLDISRREEVLFLELIEGSGRHVRAHNGQCFFYSEHGHWNAYKGVVPQGTLARCKKFLIQLEGVYALFESSALRNSEGILQASQALLERHSGCCDSLLAACERAAICRMPSKANTRDEGDGAEDHRKALPWTVAMANTIGKLYVKLQTSLLNDSLIKYYIAWCSLDIQPSGGFCTTDACFTFTDAGLQAVPKAAANDVYVYLPHKMLDPVADDVRQRVHLFWQTTYWDNANAFEVFMASFTLALRGENVDRAFWGIGAGGVGQSLQTAHLEAILGEYHTCLDMNIYFVDEEMRKQAANIVGKIVVTGQESVQGSRRPMREDIYKKHISADKVPEFSGVTEETLNSMFRRTAVCKYKSVFVDAARIAGKEKLAAAHGIFPRDPTLKDFLRDGPACLVTLRCLWNYARSRTAFQCRDVLEKYAVRGGDGGLTLATVRRSCGLSPDETATVDPLHEVLESLTSKKEPSGEIGGSKPDVSQARDMIAAHRDEEKQTIQQIRQWLCDERKDWFTVHQLKSAKSKFAFNFNKQEAQKVIEKLTAEGKLISAPSTLPKVGQTTIFLPTYPCEKALGDVVPLKHDENLIFTEEYNVENVCSRLAPTSSRSLNLKTLAELYRKRIQGPSRKKGAPKRSTNADVDDAKLPQSLEDMMSKERALYREIQDAKPDLPDANDRNVTVQQSYFYPMDLRCRRFVSNVGAQNLCRLTRSICCPDTTDYDVMASMFTIVVQLFDLVKPADFDIPSWRAIAKDRATVCSTNLKCNDAQGKQILMEVANGASPDKFDKLNKQGMAFLKALSSESRQLRWLACSQMPAEYTQLRRHSKNNWPEASIFAAWWTPAEDHILQVMVEEVQKHGFDGHMSCHFDGLLISTSMMKSVEMAAGKSMITVLQEAIGRKTPFDVVIKDKTLPSFDMYLSNKLKESEVGAGLGGYHELLTAVSNSIPAAMTFLGADIVRLRKESPSNAKADRHCVRQYSDWHGCGDLYLLPQHAGILDVTKDFLLHLELPESSFCMGVKVVPNNNILAMRAGKVYEGTMAELVDLLESYHGTKQTFCFAIASEDPDLDDTEVRFLDLLAGSSSASSVKKRPASIPHQQDPQNEGEVDVGIELRRLLCDEVKTAIQAVRTQAGKSFPPTVCPCCPWRRFERRRCLVEHLQNQHTESKRFCPAGTKMLRVVAALYDHDRLHDRAPQPTFLARASELLRKTVKGNMPSTLSFIDKFLRCVFHSDGPEFVTIRSVTKATGLRRVGNLFYDHDFADAFLQAAAAHNASLHKIQAYFLERCTRNDGKLASVIPRGNNGFWTNVLEDLMGSPLLEAYTAKLMDRCAQAEEFKYISLDATFKINLKIIGQANFHSSASTRSQAIIPEDEAAYRTMTCRGRTGATLALCGIRSEKSSILADALRSSFTNTQRAQVLHVASDAPSAEMFQTLKEVLPNLQSLSLDAMHIVMVYDQNMNNRRTAGSRWLAVIMNKFRKRHSSRTQASWGEFYSGGTLGSAPQDVRSMRDCLSEPDMSENAARELLERLDPDTPWLTEVDFLQALVAHFSFFREELRKVTFTGVSLHRLIVNVASPAKFQWLLNDTRYRHSINRQELVLLPSGTTSNESLHHEVNVWFRETAT